MAPVSILLSVTPKELRGLFNGTIDLIIRDTYPTNPNIWEAQKTFRIYFVLKKSQGAVLATGDCQFIMKTTGLPAELKRAKMSRKVFEHRYKKHLKTDEGEADYYSAFAWNVVNVQPVNMHITEFTTIVVRKKCSLAQVKVTPSGWIYILS